MRKTLATLVATAATLTLTSAPALATDTPAGTLDANTLPAPAHNGGGLGFSADYELGQTFTALGDGDVTSIQLHVQRYSSGPGDLSVDLTALDDAGRPTAVLATTSVPADEVTQNAYSLATASFEQPAAVEAGRRYGIVLSTPSGCCYAWSYAHPIGQYQGGMLMWNHTNGWEPWMSYGPGVTDAVFAVYLDGHQDTTAPVLTVPADQSVQAAGANGTVVTYSATATDDVDGAVPANCSPASGATFAPGDTAVTCSAVDAAGNRATSSFTVSVRYAFQGFLAPVTVPVTVAKAGQAIPLKFGLGGSMGADVLAAGSPSSQAVACDTGAVLGAVVPTPTPGRSDLKYDAATGRYQYVWKTDSTWTDSCRRLTLALADGSAHTAVFRFGR